MSVVSASASISALASIRSANLCSSAPRSAKPIRGHGPWSEARRAAWTARSASSAPPSATSAQGSRVHGSTEANRSPETDSVSWPSITCGTNSMTGPSSAGSRRGQVPLLGQPDGDVDDHVLLAADVAELAGSLQDLVGGDAVALGRPFGVQQEAAVDP